VIFQVRTSSCPAIPGQGVFTVRVLRLSDVLPMPCVVWFQLMLVVELVVLGYVLELPNQKAYGFIV
jgi:hypothetical protein